MLGIASRRDRALVALGLVAVAVIACAVPLTLEPASPPPRAPAALEQPPGLVADPTPVPMPSASVDVIVFPDFVPPTPACPAPLGPAEAPAIRVRVGDGDPMAATMASSTVMTCSTTGVSDVGDMRYPAPLVARPDDELIFAVDPGWTILWLDEFDHEKNGEGGNVTPGTRAPDPGNEVAVPVPKRTGDMIVGADIWLIRDDGRIVAQVAPAVWVRVGGG
jgi:hypothetical protein